MKHFSKKLLAWMLSAAMVFSCSGIMAFATETDAADADAVVTTEELPESEHNYANGEDYTWEYTLEGATNGVYVTFDEETYTESGYDYIYIYDADYNQAGKYSGSTLSGATIYVPTATFYIRLTSDSSMNEWGFKVTSVEAAGDTIDLDTYATMSVDRQIPVGGTLSELSITLAGMTLTEGTDYMVSYDSASVGYMTVTVTGIGGYTGTLTAEVYVYGENARLGADISTSPRNVRQSSDTTTTNLLSLSNMTDDWKSSITSVELVPVDLDENGDIIGVTEIEGAQYPTAPVTQTLDSDDFYFSGSYLRISRTAEDPIVYVTAGRNPITVNGHNYQQSQAYQVTIKADGYLDSTAIVTYYVGTSQTFSIIIDEDGDEETTEDQTTVKTWTVKDLEAMEEYTFANGSSQCGMTGFRTFTTWGVPLNTLLEDAGVTVSDDDYFLLDTSDDYGNNFTYEELFNTTRYFMSGIYEDGFADWYQALYEEYRGGDTSSTATLRRYLAERALANESTIEPRINTKYVETTFSSSSIATAVLPTEENTTFNSLVSYENQFRFVYGIAIEKDKVTVTFDSQGGSEVESQQVLTHYMTSSTNTTWSSSYWVESLIIYRGAGENYKTTDTSDAAETITEPEDPTREGYTFAGWYTDADCTEGNEFDFTADDGTVDVNTTLYANWEATDNNLEVYGSTDTINAVTVGSEIDPVVYCGDTVLTKGTDYTLTYDTGEVGETKAVITGIGDYCGTLEVPFCVYDSGKVVTITDFAIGNAEHDDADGELNQTIIATITFSEDIVMTADDLAGELLITIAGGDVYDTDREISYEVVNGNQLVITMVSTDWVAIYAGALVISDAGGVADVIDGLEAADSSKILLWETQSGRIPTGIVVTNDIIEGTADAAASTYVNVAHKANMRGMYSYQLLSIVDGEETVVYTGTSHAHNFYTSVDEAYIADAIATAIGSVEGYSVEYTSGDTGFVMTADDATEGETIAIRMNEYGATINEAHASTTAAIENETDVTYELAEYCNFCGEEVSRTTTAVGDTIGVRRGNTFYLSSTLSGGKVGQTFTYGKMDDEILVGDWDGDGVDTLAVRRGNVYYFTNDLTGDTPEADIVLTYGRDTDEVLVGDWDGDGCDTLAVRRGNKYYFSNDLESETAEIVLPYGRSTDEVLVGDWDGDGCDTLAVRRGNKYYFGNDLVTEVATVTSVFGSEGTEVLVGDWNSDGCDTLAERIDNVYGFQDSIEDADPYLSVSFGKLTDDAFAGQWD